MWCFPFNIFYSWFVFGLFCSLDVFSSFSLYSYILFTYNNHSIFFCSAQGHQVTSSILLLIIKHIIFLYKSVINNPCLNYLFVKSHDLTTIKCNLVLVFIFLRIYLTASIKEILFLQDTTSLATNNKALVLGFICYY